MCKLIITVLAVGMLLAFTANVAKAGRFKDNGDGTITDKQTGLMWEKKDSTCPGIHCVNDAYQWTATGTAPDGPAFTSFLKALNGPHDCTSSNGVTVTCSGPPTCFAGHCDWRLPEIDELQTIIDTNAPGCGSGSPCIDPIFGPTDASIGYWSATTAVAPFSPTTAWGVGFGSTNVGNVDKNSAIPVRAVRTGP